MSALIIYLPNGRAREAIALLKPIHEANYCSSGLRRLVVLTASTPAIAREVRALTRPKPLEEAMA